MKLYNTKQGIIIEHNGEFFHSGSTDWNRYINRKALYAAVESEVPSLKNDPDLQTAIARELLPPIGSSQEVWAAGVTYMRSKEARMEESKDAGGGDFYSKVYDAVRPEIFFKATAVRTVGHRDDVRIRKDSKWNVPEPELTLFICSAGTIEGYTIGNDMSSRDIEGENPLYLPQAKCYDGSAALGPCLYVSPQPISSETGIRLNIMRGSNEIFSGDVLVSRMKRKHTELASFLFREMSFPYGVFLMTGTGIVPPDHFTLQSGDIINITIDEIGVLTNRVA